MIKVMRESGFDLMKGVWECKRSAKGVEEVYIEREMGGKWV